jgi:hypothetical protein
MTVRLGRLGRLSRLRGPGVGEFGYMPIADLDLPFSHGGNFLVMCDHHNRPPVCVELVEQVQHAGLVFGVQFAGRLVSEDNARVIRQGAGNRDTLTLATGEPRGTELHALAQPNSREQLGGAGASFQGRDAGRLHRQLDVLDGGQVVEQVEALEDEAERSEPQPGLLGVAQLPEILAVKEDAALGGAVEQTNDLKQRALAGARRSLDRHHLCRADGQRNIVQRDDGRLTDLERPRDVSQLQ